MSSSWIPATWEVGVAESEDEVSRLRAEVEHLQAEVASARDDDSGSPRRRRGGRWRPVVVTVLLVLVGLLAPLSVVATWAHDEVGDTSRYVAAVAPLSRDPAVRRAVADQITREVFDRLDVRAVTDEAVAALSDRGLPPRAAASLSALATPLANSVRSFVHQKVLAVVSSDAFTDAWVEANRTAHDQMVGVLTGRTGDAVETRGGRVSVNLAALINTVKGRLADSGFELAANLPEIDATFTIFESSDITKAQTGFRLLSVVARGLPILALVLFGIAIAVARSRRRAIIAGSLVVAASMLLLGVALNAFRAVYLDALPAQVPGDAAAVVYDTLVGFIRLNLRALLVLFLAVAAIAWVTGASATATGVRRGTTRALDAVRSGSDRAGLDTGPVGAAVYAYRTPLRVTVLGVALVVYVMAAHPSGAFTLSVLAVALVALLVLELVARRPMTAAAGDTVPELVDR